jgi:hypothetical protein
MGKDEDNRATSAERSRPPALAEKGRVIDTDLLQRPHTTTLHLGDARDMLAMMTDGFADCIVTSPPYWAKRD